MVNNRYNKNLEVKEGIFTTLCMGVGAVAAAPIAGETIREIYDHFKKK